MRFLHLFVDDGSGEVSTVEIFGDGFVRFHDDTVDYSIQELKDVIAEAEYELDHAQDDVDLDYDENIEYEDSYDFPDFDDQDW